jgi:hypothetical protein
MKLATGEFIRRFLIHVLPKGLHRIRHYGLFANGSRAENVGRARELLGVPPLATNPEKPTETEATERGSAPRYRPTASITAIRIDAS